MDLWNRPGAGKLIGALQAGIAGGAGVFTAHIVHRLAGGSFFLWIFLFTSVAVTLTLPFQNALRRRFASSPPSDRHLG